MKIGIVSSVFNPNITEQMRIKADQRAMERGLEIRSRIQVPGAFDMPIAIQRLLERGDIEGVVTLGAIIQGGTGHDELIANALANTIHQLVLKYNKPISLGVMGPRINKKQAIERADKYAIQAVDAVIDLKKGMSNEILNYARNQPD